MSHGHVWNVFAPLTQGCEGIVEIDRIPGCNGSHEQVQATGSMHLILKGPISQFAQPSQEELAPEGMQYLSIVQADQHTPPECLIAKIVQQDAVRSSFPISVSALATRL